MILSLKSVFAAPPCCLSCICLYTKAWALAGRLTPYLGSGCLPSASAELDRTMQTYRPICMDLTPALRREPATLSLFPASETTVCPVPASHFPSSRLCHPLSLTGAPDPAHIWHSVGSLTPVGHGVGWSDRLLSPQYTNLGQRSLFLVSPLTNITQEMDNSAFLTQNAGLGAKHQ